MWRRAALHDVLGQNTDRRRTEECGTGGARTSIQSVSRTQWSSRYSSSLLVFATRLRYRPAAARPGRVPGRAAARRALYQTALGKRHPGSGAVSDDEVVVHGEVQESRGIGELPRQAQILPRGARITAWMVVNEDDTGGALPEGGS